MPSASEIIDAVIVSSDPAALAPPAPQPSLYALRESTKLALGAQLFAFGFALYKGNRSAAFFSALAAFTTYYAAREDTARGMALHATDDARSFSQAIADRLARVEQGLL